MLYNFCSALSGDCADGSLPFGGLVMDGAGHLFGTTEAGGTTGGGTVFSVLGKNETVIYNFCIDTEDCSDGDMPVAPVFLDDFGRIVGTTSRGGMAHSNGFGTLWTISGSSEQVLHSFNSKANGADGYEPTAGVIEDSAGDIFGVTSSGGDANQGGVLFEYRDGALHVLHDFGSAAGGADGCTPLGGLIMDAAGNLYGTTSACGAGSNGDGGTVFELSPK